MLCDKVAKPLLCDKVAKSLLCDKAAKPLLRDNEVMGSNLGHDIWFTNAIIQYRRGSSLELWGLCPKHEIFCSTERE